MGQIPATQSSCDVGIVAIQSRISPKIVISRLETVDYSQIVSEVPGSINIILISCIGLNVSVAKIRAGEHDFVLPGQQHLLNVDNSIAEFVAHGNARRLEFIEHDLVGWKLQIPPRFNDQTHTHARVVTADDGVGKLRELEH